MIFFGLIIALFASALDQISKFWTQEILLKPIQTMEILDFLTLSPSWNKGISFGLFHDSPEWALYFLIGISLILIVWLLVLLFQRKSYLLSMAIGLILGGALGNLADRFIHGAVFDFIDVHYKGFHFWTFNIADSFITLGAILFALDILRDHLKSKEGRKK